MKVEDVRDEWVHDLAASLDHPSVFMGGPSERSKKRARAALAAVIPAIQAEALERAADLVDCGCAHKSDVLAVRDENSGDRWRACGQSTCGALEAHAIRAMKEGT